MWILAPDVGTGSVRAIGCDALGRPRPGAGARVGCEPTTTSGGGSGLDPEELVAAATLAINRCGASAPGPPAAVGASVLCRDIHVAARARQGRLYDGVVGPRAS